MANKSTSELNDIGSNIAADDLLCISDISQLESKKMTMATLNAYLLASGSFQSGSFFGTASYATLAKTASYVDVQPTASYAITSSYASNVIVPTVTISSSWASSSVSSSYALTSSFASSANVATAALAIVAGQAYTASYINPLSPGIDNGTVYNSINSTNATNATNAIFSLTASYLTSTVGIANVTSASHANVADSATNVALATNAINAIFALSAYTASVANALTNSFMDYGIFTASFHSVFISQLNTMSITPMDGLPKITGVKAIGTLIEFYPTAAISITNSIYLAISSSTVPETILDSLSFKCNSSITGMFEKSYTLMGQTASFGNYMVYVSCSNLNNYCKFDPDRKTKFNIVSLSDTVTAHD